MTASPDTTLGVSAGNGMIHCALVTVDDHGRLGTESRVIDVDPTDRLDRAGRVNSGIDLMLDRARRMDSTVAYIGVACRTTAQGREIASRGVGPRRQIHLVGDAEAVAHALAESGEIAAHPEVVVVDCGDTGVTMFRLRTAAGGSGDRIRDIVRSTALSGFALDAALADQVVAASTTIVSRADRAALVSGCRTAKEDLVVDDSTTFQVGGVDRAMSVAMLTAAITPMANTAAAEIADYLVGGAIGQAPPVVLVGGLANIAALHDVLARECGVEVIAPGTPELLCAVGAALLAQSGATSARRLAFIGGRRYRDLMSAVPLAIVGSLLAGAMLTVYAVGTALTGNSTPERYLPSDPTSSTVGSPSAGTDPASAGDVLGSATPAGVTTTPAVRSSQVDTGSATTSPRMAPGPSWATTELPTTVPSSAVPTFTIVPNVGPSTTSTPPTTTAVTPSDPSTTPPTTSAPTTTNVPFESPVPSSESESQTPIVTTVPPS